MFCYPKPIFISVPVHCEEHEMVLHANRITRMAPSFAAGAFLYTSVRVAGETICVKLKPGEIRALVDSELERAYT